MRYLSFICAIFFAQLAQAQSVVVTHWPSPGACNSEGVWGGTVAIWVPSMDTGFEVVLSRYCDNSYSAYFQGITGDPNVFTRPGISSAVRADILALIAAPCSNCPEECDPVNESLIGTNCCPSPQFGATYTLAVDENDCEYLACLTANCHSCPSPPTGNEGDPCQCESGGNGVKAYTYDANGCPTGFFCDECEQCPTIPTEDIGNDCACSEEQGGGTGKTATREGPDGCPELYCKCLNCPELTGEGEPCEYRLEDGTTVQGKYEIEEIEGECPIIVCKPPACYDQGGDEDEDGCCDDEDPDPQDSDKNCKTCIEEIHEKFAHTVGVFRSKVGIGQTTVTNSNWTIVVDSVRSSEVVEIFPVSFELNLTTLSHSVGTDHAAATTLSEHLVTQFGNFRSTFRQVMGYCIWLLFGILILRVFTL